MVQSATVSCTDAIKTAWTTGWCLKLAQFVTAHHAWCMAWIALKFMTWTFWTTAACRDFARKTRWARSFSHLLACPRHLCRWHPSGSHFPVQLWTVCWNLSRYCTCKNEKLHKHMRARQCSLIRVRILGVLMSFAVVQFGHESTYEHESDTYVAYASWLKRHSSPNLQLPLSRKS